MYKKVLVPLDNSALAECTLTHVKNLAKDGHVGEVILLSVVEMKVPINYIEAENAGLMEGFDFQTIWNEEVDKSQQYLAEVQSKLNAEGITTKTVLIKGPGPADGIIDFSRKQGVDLIVIATHGYTGLKKLLIGSVAFKVLHESHVPVLLIRPESCMS